jgi:hypothetical protein
MFQTVRKEEQMALIEQTVIDKYEVVGDFKHIQVREDARIVDDVTGEVKSRGNFVRHVLSPGDDVSTYPAGIQAIAGAEWTQDVIDAYQAHIANN